MSIKVLSGRNAIITGASRGLGNEIARQYLLAGCNLVICSRDIDKLNSVKDDLSLLALPGQTIRVVRADIAEENDVKNLIDVAQQNFDQIHILVNNAGVYGPKGPIEDIDWDVWMKAVRINLYGSVLMCRYVLPHFKRNRYGKIVQLSGGGATSPLPFLSAYAASKAAVIRFMETLAREVKDYHIDVNAIAPGALNTRMLDEVLEAGPEQVGKKFYQKAIRQKREGGVPLELGAQLAVFLASSASDRISGKLISAVWDPWEDLDKHLDDLVDTDVYTLRRIIPSERGMDWGERE